MLFNLNTTFYNLQGTADWHYLRKFSLTSSQAHHAFRQAIELHQDDDAWIDVAKYLHGTRSWRSDLNLPLNEQGNNNDEDSTSSNEDDAGAARDNDAAAGDDAAGDDAAGDDAAGDDAAGDDDDVAARDNDAATVDEVMAAAAAADAIMDANAAAFEATKRLVESPLWKYKCAHGTAFTEFDSTPGFERFGPDSDKETEESEEWDALFFIAFFVDPDVLDYDEFAQHREGLFDGIEIEDWSDRDEGKFAADEEEAGIILKRRNAVAKNLIFNFVRNLVPEEHRISRVTKKSQIAWLIAHNSVRMYHFYNAKGLKAEMAKKKIAFAPGSGRRTTEDMIRALSGDDTVPGVLQPADIEAAAAAAAAAATAATTNTAARRPLAAAELNAMPSHDASIIAMLNRSFLPHQKGTKREHCSLGHKLEKPILKKFIEMTKKEGSSSPAPFVNIKGAYTAGLAAKKGAVYAKDSIDFVLLVENDISTINDYSIDSDSDTDSISSHRGATGNLKAWGFEAKGRVTARTAAEEESNLQDIHFPHQRIKADIAHRHVASVAERFQVLQHSYVYDLDTVVLAISDSQSDLIRSSIIDFPKELRASFGKVLSDIKDLTLFWLYDEGSITNGIVTIPDEIKKLAEKVPGINGSETLQGTANIYVALSQLPKPFPSFHRFIPAIYAFWNTVKGGSDTTTMLMDASNVKIPKKYVNTETVAVNRLTMLLLVVIHRLFQITSSNKDLAVYKSLHRYREAANQRFSFDGSIMKMHSIFRRELEKLTNPRTSINQSPSSNPRSRPALRDIRQKYNGVFQEHISFGTTLSAPTPKKISKKVARGEADPEVEAMVRNCTGMPTKLGEKGSARRCDLCKFPGTKWFCVGCKRWFCMDRQISAEKNATDKTLSFYRKEHKGKYLHFQKTCFHKAHEEAWCRMTNQLE